MLELIVWLALIVLFLTYCPKGHAGLKDLQGWSYAHRGLHKPGVPENSMAAFKAALDHGYGIELDIHLLSDGNLAVIHDSALKRTTGAEGIVEDLTTEDLTKYHLEGTEETIPTFRQVLDLYEGKAPLIVELKPVKGNHAELTAKAVEMLENVSYKALFPYAAIFALASFFTMGFVNHGDNKVEGKKGLEAFDFED